MNASCITKVTLGVWLTLIAATSMAETPSAGLPVPKERHEVLQLIQECLADGKEAVLRATEPECVEYRTGWKHPPKNTATAADAIKICADENDPRRLAADSIKRLAAAKDARGRPIASTGIRILGAVFCEELDLVGLELMHSLVLDFSYFSKGIEARNFRIHGDLSLDGSYVLRDFRVYRGRVDGSIFGSESLIRNLRILDSEIGGSILLSDTLIVESVFDGMKLAGEMRFRGSAFSYLVIQFSKIGGSLDFSETEARCAYLLKKNEIGELVADGFGFGTMITDGGGKIAYDWRKKRDHSEIGQMLRRADVSDDISKSSHCDNPAASGDPNASARHSLRSKTVFVLFDNRILSSLCLTSFERPESGSPQLKSADSAIALNYTTVGTYIIMNLGSGLANPSANSKLTLEAVGLEARSLILKFGDPAGPDETFIDGLRVDRVYTGAQPQNDLKCPYQRLDAANLGNQGRQTGYFSEISSGLRAPTLGEMTFWLNKNQAKTIQPFTAFIEALEKSGQDSLPMRVARARKDLEIQWDARSASESGYRRFTPASVTPKTQGDESSGWVSSIGQLGYFALWYAWGRIADFGYRPLKAVPAIPVAIILFGLYFWVRLGIVGFRPKEMTKVSPIGILFLFDRMIPLYNIRQEHYQIAAFYRWVRKSPRHVPPAGGAPGSSEIQTMRYLWFEVPVTEVKEPTRRAEGCLDFMRLVGVALAVFVAAAVNALVSR